MRRLGRLIYWHWFWFAYCACTAIHEANTGHPWRVTVVALCAGLQLAWAVNGGVILRPDESDR